MKRFALLVLRNNANWVMAETTAPDKAAAITYFNNLVTLVSDEKTGATVPLGLDANGYRKGDPQVGDTITYTIAEYFNS